MIRDNMYFFVQNFSWANVLVGMNQYIGVKLLDRRVDECLTFLETDRFPKSWHHFTYLLPMYERSRCSTSSPKFGVFALFDLIICHYGRYIWSISWYI